MNTLPISLYKFMEYGLAGGTFQGFVDHYAEKYNKFEVDGFTFAPTQLGYTFSQLIASVGAVSLPTYVDPESPGYEGALREFSGVTDNIPTMKKFYRLNRVTVREKLQLAQKLGGNIPASLRAEFQDVFMGLIDEGTDGLIQSFYNALTNQRHQIVSTGQFTIDATNNPRGLKGITIKFGVPNSHIDTLTGTARWWTNADHASSHEGSASDPIGYMKDRVKAIRRTYHYNGRLRMEISKDLLDDLFTHSKVLTAIGYRLYAAASSDTVALNYAKNIGDEVLTETLRRMIGVDSIVARDSFAYVDAPGVNSDGDADIITTAISNFAPTNIAFLPEGNIGQIMGVEPLTLGYDADKVAFHNGRRLALQQRAEPKTHSIYIDSEAAQICVPSVPQYMFISTVTV